MHTCTDAWTAVTLTATAIAPLAAQLKAQKHQPRIITSLDLIIIEKLAVARMLLYGKYNNIPTIIMLMLSRSPLRLVLFTEVVSLLDLHCCGTSPWVRVTPVRCLACASSPFYSQRLSQPCPGLHFCQGLWRAVARCRAGPCGQGWSHRQAPAAGHGPRPGRALAPQRAGAQPAGAVGSWAVGRLRGAPEQARLGQ